MKKIHITEAQLECLRKKLSEAITVDATKEVEAKSGNVAAAWNDMKTKNPTLQQQASGGELSLSVNPEGIDEEENGKPITKKQIKEAKIKKLRENSEVFKKSDLR